MAPSVLATARFVAHFAVQDLFPFKRRRRSASFAARLADAAREAVSCTPTLLNMLVVAMLVFAGLVIGGIVMGALTLIHDQIEHNHFALCVEIHPAAGGARKEVSADDLDRLSKVRIDEKSAVDGAHGWNETAFWFHDRSGEKHRTGHTTGRTVAPGDLLFKDLDFEGTQPAARAWPFHGSRDPEIVVSRALLKELGYGDEKPAELHVSVRDEESAPRATLRVIGIVKELPQRRFLVAEGFWDLVAREAWDPDPRFGSALVGPLCATASADAVQAALDTGGFKPSRRPRADGMWLAASYPAGDWTRDMAGRFLSETLPTLVGTEARVQWSILRVELADERLLEPKGESTCGRYSFANVYVGKLDWVVPVVAFARGLGLGPDERTADMVTFLGMMSSFGRLTFGAVMAIVSALAAVNIYLAFSQTIRRKVGEIGILKAHGVGDALLIAIYVTEAALIWLGACVMAGGLAFAVVPRIESSLAGILRLNDGVRLFAMPPALAIATCGGALAVCCGATMLAARALGAIQPAQAVRLRE